MAPADSDQPEREPLVKHIVLVNPQEYANRMERGFGDNGPRRHRDRVRLPLPVTPELFLASFFAAGMLLAGLLLLAGWLS